MDVYTTMVGMEGKVGVNKTEVKIDQVESREPPDSSHAG